MAQVSLNAYQNNIREAISAGNFDQAIAGGQQILHYYPKNYTTYLLLAEACLGKGMNEEAADLALRALSVDPENVAARVHLSKANEALGDVDEAVAQMRAAFGLAPSDRMVRSELRRLVALQTGQEAPNMKLTRGGLGRIYTRGGLTTQAADEFEALLRENPDQVEVEASLAEALWRDGQRIRSIEVCQSLLSKLPYSLKANMILAETWMRSDRQDEADAHLAIVRELDPSGEAAYQMMGDVSPLKRTEAMLPVADEAGAAITPEGLAAGAAVPLAVVGGVAAAKGVEELEGLEVGTLPEWLRDMRPQEPAVGSAAPAAVGALAGAALVKGLTDQEMAGEGEEMPAEGLPAWLLAAAPKEVLEEAAKPDDLKVIEGIGPKVELLLNEAGISTYSQLAAADPADLKEILRAAELQMMDPTTWPEQARLAAEGKWDELATLQAVLKGGRLVPPDDLKVIEGIGPKVESLLNEAGISTYSQLAAADPADLKEILRVAELQMMDPTTWPEQARLAAEGKTDELLAMQAMLKGGRAVADELAAAEGTGVQATGPVITEEELLPQEAELPAWLRQLREEGLDSEVPSDEALAAAAMAAAPEVEGELPAEEAVTPETERKGLLVAGAGLIGAGLAGLEAESAYGAVPAAAVEEAVAPKEDDLTVIEGIGPKVALLLNVADINTYDQLAATDPSRLREILRVADLQMIDPTTWPEQARLAAEGKTDELLVLQVALKGSRRQADELVAAEGPAAQPAEAVITEEELLAQEAQLPTWLRLLREEGLESELPSEAEMAAAAAVTDGLGPTPELAEEGIESVTEEEIPEWLRAMRGPDEGEGVAPTEAPLPSAGAPGETLPAGAAVMGLAAGAGLSAIEQAPAEAVPEWLRVLQQEELGEGLPSEEALLAAGLVAEQGAEPVAPVGEMAIPAAEEDPNWLKVMGGKAVELPTEESLEVAGLVEGEAAPTGQPLVEEEQLPDWLQKAAREEGLLEDVDAGAVADTVTPALQAEAAAAETLAVEVGGQAAEQQEQLPEWLRVFEDDEISDQILPETAAAVEGVAQASKEGEKEDLEIPDWLKTLREDQSGAQAAGPEGQVAATAGSLAFAAEVGQEETPSSLEGQPSGVDQAAGVGLGAAGAESIRRMLAAREQSRRPQSPVSEPSAAVQPAPAVDLSHLFVGEPADEAATRSAEQTLKDNPKDRATRWKLVQAYATAGNHPAAIEHSQQLVQSGEYVDQVAAYLEAITKSGVASRQAYQVLGDAYFKGDRLPEALSAYRKALSLLQ